MPNLADGLMLRRFTKYLTTCEKHSDHLTDGEFKFVEQMREKFDGREDDSDFGLTPWNPTVSQWNWLSSIAERLL